MILATYELIDGTHIYNATGVIQESFNYIDPTVKYFSHTFISYMLVAVVVSLSFSVIPSVFLCIYPTRVYRYLSRFLSARKQLAVTAFAEALHSSLKDGLNGTCDYRALAGAPVLLPLIYSVVRYLFAQVLYHLARGIVDAVMLMAVVCVILYVKPYKSPIANISLSFHMILFGISIFAIHLWEYDTFPLELTFIATHLIPHILVALWAGYIYLDQTHTDKICISVPWSWLQGGIE